MKKALLIFTLALIAIALKGQSDSTFIYYFDDEMEETTYYMSSLNLVVANAEKSKGVKLGIHYTTEGEFSFVTAKLIGLGNCCENNKL